MAADEVVADEMEKILHFQVVMLLAVLSYERRLWTCLCSNCN